MLVLMLDLNLRSNEPSVVSVCSEEVGSMSVLVDNELDVQLREKLVIVLTVVSAEHCRCSLPARS